MKIFAIVAALIFFQVNTYAQSKPLRVGVAGLTHTHVHWILGRPKDERITLVGIAEPNKALAERYLKQHNLPMSLWYASLEEMIAKTKPEAVTAFGTIYEHLAVVENCAPKGIHVMVEKPLAVNMRHAQRMQALAEKHRIQLLTNYETTWYPTVHKANEWLTNDSIGPLTQLFIRDGHRGPKKIGVNKEFLEWLTDPVENGGGALTDFGCYGANIATWMMKGELPTGVTAIAQQFQKENNPKVEDEVTIILTYPKAKVTILPSWNWPIGRKDMEVYGTTGVIYADNRNDLRLRIAEGYDGFKETSLNLAERAAPFNDPFSFLAAVVRKEIHPAPYDLSSLENNMKVVKILDAAKESVKERRTVSLQ